MVTKVQKEDQRIHDPEEFAKIKIDKTTDEKFIKEGMMNTRIHQTAPYFYMKKNKAYAVPYPVPKTGWKAKHSYQNAGKSVEHASGYKREFLKP